MDSSKEQDAFGRIKAAIVDYHPALRDDLLCVISERARVYSWVASLEEFYAKERDTQRQNAELREENQCMRDALLFYGNPLNWRTTGHPQIDWEDKPVLKDCGRRARSALGVSD